MTLWIDLDESVSSEKSSLGGTLINLCIVILTQVITDPPLNMDILNMKLWPLITDIHSLTYRNNPHITQKSSIFNWEVGQKCCKSHCRIVGNTYYSRISCLWNSYIKCWWDCWKVYPFFPKFHEIDILNAVRGWQHDSLEWPPWALNRWYCLQVLFEV